MNKENCSKSESKDKPKEETTDFTPASQKKMLASLLFSKEAPEDIQDIRPEHFDSVVVKDMVKLLLDFNKKYPNKLPNPDEYQQILVIYLNSKKEKDLPLSKSEYLKVYDEVLSFKEEDFAPVQDLFRGLARFQAHNKAVDKIIKRKLIEKEDYDGIRELMTKAYEVGSRGGGLQDKDLSKVSDKPEFLIDGRFPKGGITFVAGRGGAGKGAFITGGIGAPITKGGIVFGEQLKQGFLILFNEEDFKSTVLNRLRNNEGNIEYLKWQEMPKDSDGFSAIFSLKDNLQLLRKKLKQVPEELRTNSLLIIDGISTFMGMKKGIEAYNDVEVRRILGPLSGLAEEFNMAVVIIGHFKKSKTSELIYAILNSTAFVDLSRIVYAIIEDEEERERHYFLPLKWNAPEFKNTGIEFLLEEKTDKIEIVGEISPDDVAELKAERAPGQSRSLGAGERAREFLEGKLRARSEKPRILEKIAKESLVCGRDTLYRIMDRMRREGLTKSVEDPFGNIVWVWIGSSEKTPISKDVKEKVDKIREEHKEEAVEKPKVEIDKRTPEEMADAVKKIREKHPEAVEK